MKSTSSEPVVLRGETADRASRPGHGTDLRVGGWTRLGAGAVLGDDVTEGTLAGLAARAEQAARAQGYAAGWAEGRRAATESAGTAVAAQVREHQERHARVVAELRSAAAALADAVARGRAEVAAAREEVAAQAVALALDIAEAVLDRELAVAAHPGAEALARALADVPPEAPVTVRMYPAERAALDPAVLDGRSAVFVDDPSLRRGDAVVETPDRVVDATISAALARVREVLAR